MERGEGQEPVAVEPGRSRAGMTGGNPASLAGSAEEGLARWLRARHPWWIILWLSEKGFYRAYLNGHSPDYRVTKIDSADPLQLDWRINNWASGPASSGRDGFGLVFSEKADDIPAPCVVMPI